MTITTEQAKKLRALISQYVLDYDANSWKGGGDPADVPLIEQDLAYSKRTLEEFIHELEGKPAVPPLEKP